MKEIMRKLGLAVILLMSSPVAPLEAQDRRLSFQNIVVKRCKAFMRLAGELLSRLGADKKAETTQEASNPPSSGPIAKEIKQLEQSEAELTLELDQRLAEYRHSFFHFRTNHYAISPPHPNSDDHILDALLSLNPRADASANSLHPGHELSGNLERIKELAEFTEQPEVWNEVVKEIQEMALLLKGKNHDGVHYEESARRAMNRIKHIDPRFSHRNFMGDRDYNGNQVPYLNNNRRWLATIAEHQASRPSSRVRGSGSGSSPPQSRIYNSPDQIQRDIENYLFPTELIERELSPMRAKIFFARQFMVQGEEIARLLAELRRADRAMYDETIDWILLHRQRNVPGHRWGEQVLNHLYQLTNEEAFRPR